MTKSWGFQQAFNRYSEILKYILDSWPWFDLSKVSLFKALCLLQVSCEINTTPWSKDIRFLCRLLHRWKLLIRSYSSFINGRAIFVLSLAFIVGDVSESNSVHRIVQSYLIPTTYTCDSSIKYVSQEELVFV